MRNLSATPATKTRATRLVAIPAIVALSLIGMVSTASAMPSGSDDLTICPQGVDCSPDPTTPPVTIGPNFCAAGTDCEEGPETTDPETGGVDEPVSGNPNFTG